jgi:predicted N-acetyltransferase YhbS
MGMAPTDIRVMTGSDYDFFEELIDLVGWGLDRDDFNRMVTSSPQGCFIASINDEKVGVVVTINYGKVAWLGNLIVKPDYRGHGIGASLMNHAIEHLTQQGVGSIRLDGVPKAIPLYHRLGFKDEYWSLRYLGTSTSHSTTRTRSMTGSDLETIYDLDFKYFKLNRKNLLKIKFERNSEYCFVAIDGGEIVGYIMGKFDGDTIRVGPWLCDPGYPDHAEELLFSLMNTNPGKNVWIGCPERNTSVKSILSKHGFNSLPSSLRMCYGGCGSREDVSGIFGLGGPDKG